MFLSQTVKNNPGLVEFAFWAQQKGLLLPDVYIIDVDTFKDNAVKIMEKASSAGIKMYFMLKQSGRNPVLGRMLYEMGFGKAAAVDYKEALLYIEHGIPLGNVGHLVQIPDSLIKAVLMAKPEIITVYSAFKAQTISDNALDMNFIQPVMLRVVDKDDYIYPGQSAGVYIDELPEFALKLKSMKGIKLTGVCGFPCFLYNSGMKEIQPVPNAFTVLKAANILKDMGFDITQINLASANCTAAVDLVKSLGGTHMEPGHGLMGTTPAHAEVGIEKQAVLYMSEISHSFGGNSYCYGGGYYPRSNVKTALIGKSMKGARESEVLAPDPLNIDYHFGLKGIHSVGDCVVMAFRSQIFVVRSQVALVEGIGKGKPEIVGIFDSAGNRRG